MPLNGLKEIAAAEARAEKMREALRYSLLLMANYAEKLNEIDGGERACIRDPDDWIEHISRGYVSRVPTS